MGSVLEQVRKKKRSLRPSLGLRVLRELAAGLGELHRGGQVHGRLDPDEVLISYDGEVRLGDSGLFALAGLDPEPEVPSIYARPGREAGPPTPADDLHALGLIGLEVLLGGPLWTKSSLSLPDVVKALNDMSPLAQAQPELATLVSKLIARALISTGPPLEADEFARELDALIEKHDAKSKPSELGAFVRVVTPMKTKDDAPTMVAGAVAPVETADDNNPFKVGTVAVNAELLAFLERGESKPGRSRLPSQGLPGPAVPRTPVPGPESGRLSWLLGAALLVLVVILLARC